MKKFSKKFLRKSIILAVILSVILTYYCFSVSAVNIIKGDYDRSGKVSSADARSILQLSLGLKKETDKDILFICDVDGDKKITSSDARLALRMSIKLEELIIITPSSSVADKTDESFVSNVSSQINTLHSDSPSASQSQTAPVNTTYIFKPIDDVGIAKPAYPDVPNYSVKPDTFVFITYGYGHGVGLSQYGAIGMARNGYNFAQILAHYYQGISIVQENIPVKTSTLHTGEKVDTYELLCRTVQQEIAGVTKSGDDEALKAQAVAAYTLLKSHKFSLPNQYTMAYSSSMRNVREDVKQAVSDVLGMYMIYNGELISTPFYAYSAGVTTDAGSVWGSSHPYLIPVTSYYDIEVEKYAGYCKLIDVKSFSSAQMKNYIKSYDSSIALSDNPAEWLQILSHDCAVSNEIGYVSAMRIGNKILNNCAGQKLRMNIMDLSIKSHCFALVYYDNNLQAHVLNAVAG